MVIMAYTDYLILTQKLPQSMHLLQWYSHLSHSIFLAFVKAYGQVFVPAPV